MEDKIIRIDREDNPDESVHQWSFCYKVEDGGETNKFSISIPGADATDESDAKTQANIKASVIKSDWVIAKAIRPFVASTTEPDETVIL